MNIKKIIRAAKARAYWHPIMAGRETCGMNIFIRELVRASKDSERGKYLPQNPMEVLPK